MTTSISDRVAERDFEIYRETDWIQGVQIATDGGDEVNILNRLSEVILTSGISL